MVASPPGRPCGWQGCQGYRVPGKDRSLVFLHLTPDFIAKHLTAPPQALLSSLILSRGSQPPPSGAHWLAGDPLSPTGTPRPGGCWAWGHVLRLGWGHSVQRHPSLSLMRKGHPGSEPALAEPTAQPQTGLACRQSSGSPGTGVEGKAFLPINL